MGDYAFGKAEKLCSQLQIEALYQTGKRFTAYPLRVTYQVVESKEPIAVLVWAPKSLFKRAFRRNRLRRLIRESYRLHNEALKAQCAQKGLSLRVAFNYVSPQMSDFATVEKAMLKALERLQKQIEPLNGLPAKE